MNIRIATALGLAYVVAGAASAQSADTESSPEALQQRIAQLESQVQYLSENQQEDWLTEQRADEIRALVHDVLADADTRASLMQNGMTAGHDGKFFLASADGNFRLNIEGQHQFRFVYNQRDNSGDDDDRWSFENRRTKIKFSGNAIDPSWKFEIQGAFSRDGGDFKLEDANITKVFENGMNLKFGQFKGPFMREELVSSKRQLAVERSLMNEEFNQDRTQGIQFGWEGETLRFHVMPFQDGFDTDNTAAGDYDTEYAATARLEWLAAGTWKQFKDMTSWSDDDFGLLVGAAAHYERDEFGTADIEDEIFTFTLDGSLEGGGWNAFAAVVYRTIDTNMSGAEEPDQYGLVVQGGFFFVPDEWEGFARYEFADADMTGVHDLSVITVGVNRYFAKHNLKWSTDLGFGLDPVDDMFSSSGAGWKTDGPGKDGQIVIRSQFQLVF